MKFYPFYLDMLNLNTTFARLLIKNTYMKKFVLKSVLLFTMLMFCGGNVCAQIDLGNILGGITGGNSSASTGDLISTLTSVFSGNKQASKNQIVGTWVYTEPAIVFESDNFLAKAGASLVANNLENKLQTYLTRYGIEPGIMTITFAEDGTFTETMKKKTIKGKWSVKESKLILTYGTIKPVSITTQVSGTTLMIVTDATQLLNFMKTIGSKSTNSSISSITSLMKSINGLQAGLTLVKKQ